MDPLTYGRLLSIIEFTFHTVVHGFFQPLAVYAVQLAGGF